MPVYLILSAPPRPVGRDEEEKSRDEAAEEATFAEDGRIASARPGAELGFEEGVDVAVASPALA